MFIIGTKGFENVVPSYLQRDPSLLNTSVRMLQHDNQLLPLLENFGNKKFRAGSVTSLIYSLSVPLVAVNLFKAHMSGWYPTMVKLSWTEYFPTRSQDFHSYPRWFDRLLVYSTDGSNGEAIYPQKSAHKICM
jgi:hypothetical protein